jgi:hypothetical protein
MKPLINPNYPNPHAPYTSRRAVDPLDFNNEPDEDPADGDFFDWIDDDVRERPESDDIDRQSDDEDED